MTVLSHMRVYNIPAEMPFVDTLASGLIVKASEGPFELVDFTVLLPTRRAIRSLRDAFLRQSKGSPMLLPRMLPLGDLDEEELFIMGWEESGTKFNEEINVDLPDAISSVHRQLMLTKRIQVLEGDQVSVEQAALLASELGRLLDQVQTEQLKFENLTALVPEEYAKHWQVTLKFLEVITKFWPSVLEEKGLIDPAERRNLIMNAQLSYWKKQTPQYPVIAAGSTGSIPVTADLLTLIAGFPEGTVILPGLDLSLNPDDVCDTETHPQYGLFRLLAKMNLTVSDVQNWPDIQINKTTDSKKKFAPASRRNLISNVMHPAEKVAEWRYLDPLPPEALQGVENITCASPDEEAGVIALILRGVLEVPNKTGALITPDRRLARRVASELSRWGISIDDSAGVPLQQTVSGSFLRLTAKLISNNFLPIDFLAVCKHPLASGGIEPGIFRRLVRTLEIEFLRGPRPAPGIEGLLALLPKNQASLRESLEFIQLISTKFCEVIMKVEISLSELLKAHIGFAESLAGTHEQLGSERLWFGDEGEVTSNFISGLLEISGALGDINGASYPALLDVLLVGQVARRNFGSHPRLAIWGLLEARLQHADLIVVSGLNEGTWPPDVSSDPWMSRPMRKEFGLPSPERRIGLTAHDFQQALLAPEVVITRSARVDGTPTVPSRWLVRLQKLLGGLDPEAADSFFQSSYWLDWHSSLDLPKEVKPISPPAPRPPLNSRPRKLSVTQIEVWMRDPYAIYARYILGLYSLPKLDVAPDAADYGTLIHSVMDTFSKKYPCSLPPDALEQLVKIGDEKFESILKYPGVWAFWWPRFLRIAEWFVHLEFARREEIIRTNSESRGVIDIKTSVGSFELTAQADRIDELKDGTLRIIDYKTGTPPSKLEVAAGFSPQLPLEALIAEAGGFSGITAQRVSKLNYWRLRGSIPAGEVSSVGDNPAALAADAKEGIAALVRLFDDVRTPYESRPRPENAPKFSDYEHLARVKEWSTSEGGSGV
jgi:ATP-dependent helicase/nuclease subunit B